MGNKTNCGEQYFRVSNQADRHRLMDDDHELDVCAQSVKTEIEETRQCSCLTGEDQTYLDWLRQVFQAMDPRNREETRKRTGRHELSVHDLVKHYIENGGAEKARKEFL